MFLSKYIRKRRTNEKFLNKKINNSNLNKILDSLIYAPNAGNLQNWRLIIIKNQETKEKLVEASYNQKRIANAPVVLIVCSDNGEIERFFGKKNSKKFGTQSCAAGIQNMLLKSEELGIASSWCSISNEKIIKKILKIPNNICLEAIICLGYSQEKYQIPKRGDINKILHYEEW